MKTIKELEADSEFSLSDQGYYTALKEVLEVIDKLQDRASKERKISKNKKYWLGCCQILNELKTIINGEK